MIFNRDNNKENLVRINRLQDLMRKPHISPTTYYRKLKMPKNKDELVLEDRHFLFPNSLLEFQKIRKNGESINVITEDSLYMDARLRGRWESKIRINQIPLTSLQNRDHYVGCSNLPLNKVNNSFLPRANTTFSLKKGFIVFEGEKIHYRYLLIEDLKTLLCFLDEGLDIHSRDHRNSRRCKPLESPNINVFVELEQDAEYNFITTLIRIKEILPNTLWRIHRHDTILELDNWIYHQDAWVDWLYDLDHGFFKKGTKFSIIGYSPSKELATQYLSVLKNNNFQLDAIYRG